MGMTERERDEPTIDADYRLVRTGGGGALVLHHLGRGLPGFTGNAGTAFSRNHAAMPALVVE